MMSHIKMARLTLSKATIIVYKNACGNSWVMNHIQMERFIVRAAMIIACEKDALKKVDDELYPYGKIPRLKRNGHSS